ncbi:MAG TPA: hypothetical protein VHN37_13255 [Actinomycetota bacterium]|nr:hypothetical protein [Actinomycetota bacterium]
MGRRLSAAVLMAVVGALFALLLATVPALAHHKDEHLQGGGNGAAASQEGNGKGDAAKDNDGDADSDSSTSHTEDDDTNDGDTPNNVPDDGDNAHPSGKDKSVENGGSGNQGNSESDPDDDGRGPDRSNGGPDKPNGSGGVDKADQDGNNGCGNDDDFEDDNEGWCGRKPKPAKPEVKPAGPCDADASMPGTQPCKDETGVSPSTPCVEDAAMASDGEEVCDEEEILGGVISRPAVADVEAPDTADAPEVLGERLAAGRPDVEDAQRAATVLGQTLPFTGSELLSYAAIAVGLLLAGAGALTLRKRA